MDNKATSFLFSDHGDMDGELKYFNEVKRSNRSPEEKKRVLNDMKSVGKKYGFTFREYFLYNFEHKTPEEQHTFISDKERISIAATLNKPEVKILLDNKYNTYLRFAEFYKRDIELVLHKNSENFREFVSKHPDFIAKSNDDYGGFGIKKFNANDYSSVKDLEQELFAMYPNGFIAEEILVNMPEFAALHPQSLNTVRVPTVRFDDRVELCHPFIRIGRGDAVVDNASSGGIMCAVDPETGVVFAAADENNNFFDVHPDTGVQLKGFRIPDWEGAVALAKKLASVLEGQRYCGWDLAYTERGWVMVEGNAGGMFIWQIPEQKGFRPELEKIYTELNIAY